MSIDLTPLVQALAALALAAISASDALSRAVCCAAICTSGSPRPRPPQSRSAADAGAQAAYGYIAANAGNYRDVTIRDAAHRQGRAARRRIDPRCPDRPRHHARARPQHGRGAVRRAACRRSRRCRSAASPNRLNFSNNPETFTMRRNLALALLVCLSACSNVTPEQQATIRQVLTVACNVDGVVGAGGAADRRHTGPGWRHRSQCGPAGASRRGGGMQGDQRHAGERDPGRCSRDLPLDGAASRQLPHCVNCRRRSRRRAGSEWHSLNGTFRRPTSVRRSCRHPPDPLLDAPACTVDML